MKWPVVLLAPVTASCAASPEDTAYRDDVGCYGYYFYGESARRDAFRARAIVSGRKLGHGPDKVAADAEAVSTNFIRETQGFSDDAIQRRQEELEARCQRLLAG